MEEAEIATDAKIVEKFAVGGEEAVEEGIGGVAFAGLGDEVVGLFNDEEVGVFVEDFKAYVLIGFDGEFERGWGMVGLRGSAVRPGSGSWSVIGMGAGGSGL